MSTPEKPKITFVNIAGETIINGDGRLVKQPEDSRSFVAKKKAPSAGRVDQNGKPVGEHKGWAVEGHKPGVMEAAQKIAEDTFVGWYAMTSEARAAEMKAGKRAPMPWNEAIWRMKARKAKVRARPFEIPSSADECKALAERSGWLDVVVIELKKDGK